MIKTINLFHKKQKDPFEDLFNELKDEEMYLIIITQNHYYFIFSSKRSSNSHKSEAPLVIKLPTNNSIASNKINSNIKNA